MNARPLKSGFGIVISELALGKVSFLQFTAGSWDAFFSVFVTATSPSFGSTIGGHHFRH